MGKETSVLLVDDDPQLIRLVRANLESVGYRVMAAIDAQEALETIDREMPDLIVLDIMLPEVDGYELCRRIREFASIPIIMLTAKVEDIDKVKGLRLGADDYVTKPFNVQELLARIEAVLRRTRSSDEPDSPRVVTVGDVTIDFFHRRVLIRGQEVALTLTEYKLLSQLIANAGRVMLHRELLTRVWGPEYQGELEYLRAYILHLRRKIEEDSHRPRYIITQSGIGYVFVDPTRQASAEDSAISTP